MRSNEISLWDLFGVIRRHVVLFVVGFVVVFALVAAATFSMSRKYRSEAQLQLKLGRENLGLDPASALSDQASVSMAQSPDQEVNTIANVLGSRNIAAMVVEELTADQILSNEKPGFIDSIMGEQPELAKGFSPYHTLSPEDQAIWKIQDKIKIRPVKESNTIKIHFDSKDPAKAQKIVDSYVRQYLKEHRRIHHIRGSEAFLNKVVDKHRDELEAYQEQLKDIRGKNLLVAVPEQRSALIERRSKVKSDLIIAQVDQKSASAVVTSLKKTLKELSETQTMAKTEGGASKAATAMRSQLFNLEIQEKQLLAKFDENHFRVVAIQKQIADVKKILDQEEKQRIDVVEGPSKSFQETNRSLIEKEAMLDGVNERIRQLQTALLALDEELMQLNQDEIKIDRLEREISVARSAYHKYKVEAEQARIDEALTDSEISNLRVVPASLDPFPVFPIVPLNLAIGFVLACFSGVGLAFAGEIRAQRKRSAASAASGTESNGSASATRTDRTGEPSVNGHSSEFQDAPEEDKENETVTSTSRLPR